VKAGDKDKFTMEMMSYNIDVRDVTDSAQFSQNLMFTAAQCLDEEKGIAMMKMLA